jgi:hypothetical protein
MKALRHIWKWLYGWLSLPMGTPASIDSHKWQTKIEVMHQLSGGCY